MHRSNVQSVFAAWSDLELEQCEQASTALLLKALAVGDGYTELAFAELRLRERLSRTHMKGARKADKWLVSAVLRAKILRASSIDQLVGKYVKFWSDWADDNAKAVLAVTQLAHSEGKSAIYQRAFGEKRRPIYNGPPYEQRAPVAEIPIPEEQDVEKAKAALITPHTSLADLKAIEQISKGQMFWIGRYHNQVLRGQIEQVSREILLEQGLPREVAAERLAGALGYNNGYLPVKPLAPIPAGWKGSTKQYFDGVAANAATVSRIHSSLTAMVEMGFDKYEVLAAMDERTCSICESMNGAVLDVRPAFQHITEVIGATSPGAVKELHPWLNPADFAAELKARGMGGMTAAGLGYPSFHFKCRCSVDINPESMTRPVQVPAAVKVPKGAKPIGPQPEIGTDLARLHSVLQGGGRGDLAEGAWFSSVKSENQVRQVVAEALERNYGIVRKITESSRWQVYADDSFELGNAAAQHFPRTGLIRVRERVAKQFRAAIDRLKRGGIKPEDWQIYQRDYKGFRTAIHEEIHGASPHDVASKKPRWFYKFDEATTEVAARKVAREAFGFTSSEGQVPWGLPRISAAGADTHLGAGGYKRYVRGLIRAVNTATGRADAHMLVERASMTIRMAPKANWTADRMLSEFAKALEVSAEEAKAIEQIVKRGL